ncbi:MAG: YaeQ family protein, partial [Pseudomonadota bacterium]
MAVKATIYKIKLEISDLDRHYYQSHELTIACHPSETEQRMMVRVLAFAMYASDRLSFTKGLCADDEPELWDKNLSDDIELWISLGQVEEKQIRKSLGRSKQVVIFTYASQKSTTWWKQNQSKLEKLDNLKIIHIKTAELELIQALVSRNMDLQCTIQDGLIWLSNSNHTITIEP